MGQNTITQNRELLDDSDAFEGPWLASIEEGNWVNFAIDRTQTWVERVVPPFDVPKSKDGMINQMRANMRDIEYDETNEEIEEDGEHIVPFWACAAIKKAFKKSDSKKWIDLQVRRSTTEKTYPDGEVKTLNLAEIVLIAE